MTLGVAAGGSHDVIDGFVERPLSGQVTDQLPVTDGLEGRYAGLDTQLRRLDRLSTLGTLAAEIAHEVRNPLAGMKGALEVLRGELSVKPSNLEIVDELLAQIVRLEGLVRDLLTYARPRALSPRAFDLHELIDRVLRLYKDEADVNGITVHRVSAPGTGRIFADPQAIEQVFINLIHNSIQAMEDGGTLTVDEFIAELQ